MDYPIIHSSRCEFDFSEFYSNSHRDYPGALQEMKRGRKTGHWIWYILPQLSTLGTSRMAKHFGLKSLHESVAYFNDPVLGPRLVEICSAIVRHLQEGVNIQYLMGSSTDATKLLTCATLFSYISSSSTHGQLFKALREYCEQSLHTENQHTITFCEVSLLCVSPTTQMDHITKIFEDSELSKLDRVQLKSEWSVSDDADTVSVPSADILSLTERLLPPSLSSEQSRSLSNNNET